MQQPNQPIEEVFKEVRRNVGKETNGAQLYHPFSGSEFAL